MFTKQQFEQFRRESEEALKTIAEKYNVNIKTGKIKYDSDSFDMNVSVTKKEVNGKSFEQAEFEKYCFLYGFSPEDYNKTFISGGKKFILYGFKTSARTMPVLAKGNDGKNYKFGTEVKKLIVAQNEI